MDQHIPCYYQNPKDGTEMVLIPGGRFWMGSEDSDAYAYDSEKPRHLHYIEPFYLGIACVTVSQFRKFAEETRHIAGSDWGKDPDDHPMRYVNWHDAKAYCAWAGLRLPTEAAWEIAARGYEGLKYPWGNDWEDGRGVCWDKQKGPKGNTAPVLDHPEGVSRFGQYQQSGNLWEWCEDVYDGNVYQRYAKGEFNVPEGSGSGVVRGGSWYDSYPRRLRSGYRDGFDPGLRGRSGGYGFRTSRTVTF